jgi:cation diffusion facilitator CzcD-associated flavoprotein CzcO
VKPKNIRVAVIGAGMAGILAAIKLLERGDVDVTVYEKADRIGGTWRENTYPGLTCDVPSHHYSYSFERNPDWSQSLAPGPEIQQYFEHTVKKYGIDSLIRFNSEIVSAEFDDGRWHLQLASGATDTVHILIAATGVLHHPSYPSIPGIDTFKGALFHTARWDHSVPLAGKRIGVIGMGSTGVQIVSALVDRVAKVEHFVRTPQWIMPVAIAQYSAEQRAAFRADPKLLAQEMDVEGFQAAVENYTLALTAPTSEGAQVLRNACFYNLEHGVTDPALREQLRPDHEPLCKRLIFSPDYYQAIQKPTAALVREDIKCIEERGVRTKDGVLHELDVIALATGFRADRFMRPMQITGRNGVTLEEFWRRTPRAYLAITMPDFPNLFMLNGPNGPVGNFSLIDIAEQQWHYIDQLLDKICAGECSDICVTRAALEKFDRERIAAAKTTVWYTGGCTSWYLDAEGIPASWPWNFNRFVSEMRQPRWSDFDMDGVAVADRPATA